MPRLEARITNPAAQIEGVPARWEQTFAIDIENFGPEEIRKALADSEYVTSLLRDHPEEMRLIFNEALGGRIGNANREAAKIGLTEDAFRTAGGGWLFWAGIAVAGAIILAYAAFSESGSADPVTVPADAGTG